MMSVQDELAKTTARSAYAVVAIQLFIVLCIISYNGLIDARSKIRDNLHRYSEEVSQIISRSRALEEVVPFASCLLAEQLFYSEDEEFSTSSNFFLAARLSRSGDVGLRFHFLDEGHFGQCRAEVWREAAWIRASFDFPIDELNDLIVALNGVNESYLLEHMTSAQELAAQYELALTNIGMKTDAYTIANLTSLSETMLGMIRRDDVSRQRVTNWIVYHDSPFSFEGGAFYGEEFFRSDELEQTVDEFIFEFDLIMLFSLSLPDLPSGDEIWAVSREHSRSIVEMASAEPSLRLPFLNAAIEYKQFLLVSGTVLVIFLAFFSAVYIDLAKRQSSLPFREKQIPFPRLNSPNNPLDLRFMHRPAWTARIVWGAFLVSPLILLSFATIFRYDASSIENLWYSANSYFSWWQGWQVGVMDAINLGCLLGVMVIVRAILMSNMEPGETMPIAFKLLFF